MQLLYMENGDVLLSMSLSFTLTLSHYLQSQPNLSMSSAQIAMCSILMAWYHVNFFIGNANITKMMCPTAAVSGITNGYAV